MQRLAGVEPRTVCGRCRRPTSVCYCRHLTTIGTRTRVVLLQHPRERDVAIGTARMASLCLPEAELHVGVRWDGSPELARALSDEARPPVLLYPGDGAIDVAKDPPRGPVTLVVVDGTWWQAKKVVRENRELARLPRYSFTPPSPSEYRIRKEPHESYVSTLEALVHVLGVLEGDRSRFQALLTPFRAMIDAQLDCQTRFSSSRTRHAKLPKARRPRLPAILHERRDDLVCVVGEANAWPYHSRGTDPAYPDELLHWAARRLHTGETFELLVAPSHPVAPATPTHVGLPLSLLAKGSPRDALLERWRAFVRESDVVCSWGRYATSLFVEGGGDLPAARVDLRQVARVFTRGKVGTLEGFVERAGLPWSTSRVPGRAGMRLEQVAAIGSHFCSLAGAEREV
jgi:DTW domain-containing protein